MSNKFKVGDKITATLYTDSEYWNNGKLEVTEVTPGSELVHAKTPDGKIGAWSVGEVTLDKPTRDYIADHARRTLRAAGLSKKDARRVVEEIAKSRNYDLSKFSRSLPESASGIVLGGFSWSATPEGGTYWDGVYAAQIELEQHKKKEQGNA